MQPAKIRRLGDLWQFVEFKIVELIVDRGLIWLVSLVLWALPFQILSLLQSHNLLQILLNQITLLTLTHTPNTSNIIITDNPVVIEVIKNETHENYVLDRHQLQFCTKTIVLVQIKGRLYLHKVHYSYLKLVNRLQILS